MSDWKQSLTDSGDGWEWKNERTGETASPKLFGYDASVFDLLDQASQKLGITNPNYKQLAQDIIKRDNINGGRGYMQGASAADVANNIIREASFQPEYKATFDSMSPEQLQQVRNSGYSNGQGYFDPSSSVYKQQQQSGIDRENQLRAGYANADAANRGFGNLASIAGLMLGGSGALTSLGGSLASTLGVPNMVGNALVSGGASALTGGDPLVGAATGALGSLFDGGSAAAGAGTQLPGGQSGFDILNGMDLANANPSILDQLKQAFGETQGLSSLGQVAQATTSDVGGGLFDGINEALGVDPSVFDKLDVANNTSYGTLADAAGGVGAGATGIGTGALGTAGAVAGAAGLSGLGKNETGDPDLSGIGQQGYNTLPGNSPYTTTAGGATTALTLKDLLANPTAANFTKLLTGEGGGYQLPLDKLIGGLLEGIGGIQKTDALTQAVNKATAAADPFASQRPFYQGELNKMFTDPNYFSNNALLKGANANAVNDTSRALAARGYNMSGNEGMDIAGRLQNNNMTYAQNLMNSTGGFAGAGFGPGLAGQVGLTGNTAVANQGMQNNGTLGNIIQNLFKGGQSNTPNTSTGTVSNNNSLSQFLFG